MISGIINQAFSEMISTSRIHRQLGITAGHVRVIRKRLRDGQAVSLDKKIRLLEKAGWNPGVKSWTDQDMVGVVKFTLGAGAAAKDLGAAYLFEKFKNPTR